MLKLKSRNFLVFILLLQFIVCVTVFFDVPIARQVVGFIYFTVFPGFIIIKLLKMDKLDGLKTLLFSVGLSIAFLMFAGLCINEFSLFFGFSEPLSPMPSMIILNSLILIGGVLVYLRSENVKILSIETLGLSPFALLFLSLPILSVLGVMWVKAYESNLILLFTIIAIALLFGLVAISKSLPPNFYPLCIFVIAISLLYHSSLICNNLIHFGSDSPGEYFAFKIVEKDAHWSSINPYIGDSSVGRTYAMLSVTILPLIYSGLLNLNPILVFKVLYPAIFSLVPLGLYKVWSRFMGSKYAFISAFFFMAYQTFYTEMLGLNKQMIGELFFVFLLLVILNKKMKPIKKKACLPIFSFALIVSHYALAEIFLFFITFALILLILIKRSSKNITIQIVLYFFVIMFSWYIYTSSSSVFNSFLDFGNHVYNQLGDLFNIEARAPEVLRGLGLEAPPTIWNAISRIFAYFTEAFILIGFIGLLTKRTKIHVEKDYLVFISISMVFLVALISIPGLADTMNMTRFYHILLFFIAPLCVIGVEVFVNMVHKRKSGLLTSILLLTVLVPYFLFQTGFVYEVTGSDSWSVPLSKYRMNASRLYGYLGYTDKYNIFGAQWLSKNVDVGGTLIYGDYFSRGTILRSYGMVYMGYVEMLSNTTEVVTNGTVYLNRLNVIEGTVIGVLSWNTTELSFLSDLNKVYSNSGNQIYKK